MDDPGGSMDQPGRLGGRRGRPTEAFSSDGAAVLSRPFAGRDAAFFISRTACAWGTVAAARSPVGGPLYLQQRSAAPRQTSNLAMPEHLLGGAEAHHQLSCQLLILQVVQVGFCDLRVEVVLVRIEFAGHTLRRVHRACGRVETAIPRVVAVSPPSGIPTAVRGACSSARWPWPR
eukprot:scaffold19162_cov118-Isochrysis_galbana.AAC.5